ncbi:alcohol dehydrogenase catalytic domain-containing protein [Ruania halotolerans]|uniref:alcohol dehydrogenase catalytic domain-containing protein n=1 Tax=Ruania halotolerans TaxID=2897773 RepID=UPI001E2D3110|nr:zinc-binding dehydrogenase [Ruania halotolerans]UFU06268.1 zinc-binding dehydrogenase [Ruania halotolerans]
MASNMITTVTSRPAATEPVVEYLSSPRAGAGQIVVDLIASAVNPFDLAIASGAAREAVGLTGPVGLGWDVTGVVREVGSGVTRFAVGDVIAAIHPDLSARSRAHAEQVLLEEDWAAVLPDGLDPVAAASIPLNALTAAQALALLGPAAGRRLLVTGAAGAVGGYAVALAATAGWQVVALAREADEEFVRAAGADDMVTAIPAGSVDAVFDAAALREEAIIAVRDGGAFVGVLPIAPTPPTRGIASQDVFVQPAPEMLADLLARSASGELAIRVAGTRPLTDAAQAYQRVSAGGQRGRWLLVP